jgi:hypothetical protein
MATSKQKPLSGGAKRKTIDERKRSRLKTLIDQVPTKPVPGNSVLLKQVEKKNSIRDRANSPADMAKVDNYKVTAPAAAASKVEIEVIRKFDPGMAKMLLENTPSSQRTLRPRLVDRYAGDILAGRWRATGDPIRLNSKLELIDGQHRCAAVIKADRAVSDVVLEILHDDRAFEALDQAAPRNLRDVMKMTGQVPAEPTVMAAVIYEHLDFVPKALSMPEKMSIVQGYKDLDAIKVLASHRVATAGMLAAFIRCSRIDRSAAVKFFEAAFTNKPIVDGVFNENVHLLATWIHQMKHDRRVGKSAEGWKRECACRCISAWNAWRTGRVLKRIIYSPTDSIPKAQ